MSHYPVVDAMFFMILSILIGFIFLIFLTLKKYWTPLHVWRWKNRLHIKEHINTLSFISKDINGFECSKRARRQVDAPEYVYGEIDCLSFIALLSLVKPNQTSVFYDLGSGTGKAVLACAMVFGVKKSCGIELFSSLDEAARIQLEKLRYLPNYKQASDSIEFICDDFLNVNVEDATIIFISATALFGDTWQQLNQCLERLSSKPVIITTTKPLLSKNYTLVHKTQVQMSWGIVDAYIQTMSTDVHIPIDAIT